MQISNVRVVNAPGQPGAIGFDAGTNLYNGGNHTYQNVNIEGFETGLLAPRGETVVVDGGSFANPVRSIYRIRPDISPFNEDGTFNFDFNSTYNPVAEAQEEIRRNTDHRILAGAGLSYEITDGVSFESLINMNQTFQDRFIRLPAGYGVGLSSGGRGEQDSNFLFSWLFRNLFEPVKSFYLDQRRVRPFPLKNILLGAV